MTTNTTTAWERLRAKLLANHDCYDADVTAVEYQLASLAAPETDEAWMARVYPDHGYVPSEGMTYAQFCRAARATWDAQHAAQAAPAPCVWKRDGKSWTWLSGCGYQFEAAFACDPTEDEMHWCSFCGHPLAVEREP